MFKSREVAEISWHLERRDGKTCVIKDSDGSVAGCHDSRAKALAQQRALYANEPGMTAALAPLKPPRSLFERVEPDEPTAMTYEESGAVYGHLAAWDTCHVGLSNGAYAECVRPPASRTDYARFHLGQMETAEGDMIAVGKIVVATGHAPMSANLEGATKHYDNTGSVGAYVRARNGQHGIWASGVLRSDISDEQLRDLRANPPSGDWRLYDHSLELVAALAVPVPGFPIPPRQLALSASGEISALILTEDTGDAWTDSQRLQKRLLATLV